MTLKIAILAFATLVPFHSFADCDFQSAVTRAIEEIVNSKSNDLSRKNDAISYFVGEVKNSDLYDFENYAIFIEDKDRVNTRSGYIGDPYRVVTYYVPGKIRQAAKSSVFLIDFSVNAESCKADINESKTFEIETDSDFFQLIVNERIL